MLKSPRQSLGIKYGRKVINLIVLVMSIFPRSWLVVLMNALSKSLNLSAVGYIGEHGEFIGSPYDRHTIGKYIEAGTYSQEIVYSLIEYFNKTSGTFIDIGANIGLISIPLQNKGIRCICFEPDPNNFKFLKLNFEIANNAVPYDIYMTALYDKEGEMQLELSPTNSGDYRIRNEQNHTEPDLYDENLRLIETINTERLDDIIRLDDIERPLLIKIDAQGAEVAILHGGLNTLSSADALLFEFSTYLIRRQYFDETELAKFIIEYF